MGTTRPPRDKIPARPAARKPPRCSYCLNTTPQRRHTRRSCWLVSVRELRDALRTGQLLDDAGPITPMARDTYRRILESLEERAGFRPAQDRFLDGVRAAITSARADLVPHGAVH